MDMFLLLKWLEAVTEAFLFFSFLSVPMFLTLAFMVSQCFLANKSPAEEFRDIWNELHHRIKIHRSSI